MKENVGMTYFTRTCFGEHKWTKVWLTKK